MMKGVVPGLAVEIVIDDRLYEFDRSVFGIDEMLEEEMQKHACDVAKSLLDKVTASPLQ